MKDPGGNLFGEREFRTRVNIVSKGRRGGYYTKKEICI